MIHGCGVQTHMSGTRNGGWNLCLKLCWRPRFQAFIRICEWCVPPTEKSTNELVNQNDIHWWFTILYVSCRLCFLFIAFRFLHKFILNFQWIQIFPTWNEYVQNFHHFLKKGFYNHSYLEVVLCLLVSSFKFSLSQDPSKQIIWQAHGITSPALASDPSKSQLPLIVELADWKAW